MKTVLSLGAGVQSSTLALMAERGVLPRPDAAIFADTQDESPEVYKWLDWLETQLSFPVIRATKGKLAASALHVRFSKNGNYYIKSAIPAFIVETVRTPTGDYIENRDGDEEFVPDGGFREEKKIGLMNRQCTADFKIVVIQQQIRKLRDTRKDKFIQWIGISTDEAARMKPSRLSYVENIWPLIDQDMSRGDCVLWMAENGYPKPPRSSCVYCPFHSDEEWMRLKADEPEQFLKAVRFERLYQRIMRRVTGFRGTPYLHRSCVPLDQVVFSDGSKHAFVNECEGICGV